eukprot:NODE_24305_length_630_cov_3.500994.p3 GENE.NODE_24305_length_630_cov_3.500994~~NODE_24305_length_630_cov_3.500994.p3  ORF type:complete len:68 (-),score=23.60 NODE_24305_length_630_cov_3.500994:56-259(-)
MNPPWAEQCTGGMRRGMKIVPCNRTGSRALTGVCTPTQLYAHSGKDLAHESHKNVAKKKKKKKKKKN